MADKILKSEDLTVLLEKRYCSPAWAFLPQVRNGTGFARSARTADAIAMSLWPSRGLDLYGFEIKVSRQDLIRELKNPEKAEEIAQYCDFWMLVVSDKKLIDGLAIPPNWGVLAPRGSNLVAVKEEKKLESKEPNRLFLGEILRKVVEIKVPTALLKAEHDLGKKEGAEEATERCKRDYDYQFREHDKLEKKVVEFEKASGVSISGRWNSGEEIGNAVRQVLNGEHTRVREQLVNLREQVGRILKGIDEELKK